VVGDPMQSIYSFRDADVELFPRVKESGLEIPQDEPLKFNSVGLTANFRTTEGLVNELNDVFEECSRSTTAAELSSRAQSRTTI